MTRRLIMVGLVVLLAATQAQAASLNSLQSYWRGKCRNSARSLKHKYNKELLAKAAPDECFVGLGDPGNTYPATFPCTEGVPKVNEAYVWGLAKSGCNVWFGTLANTHCLVIEGFLGLELPHANRSWACEFGLNPLGDWRPPHVYHYKTATGELIDRTPASGTAGMLMASTVGLRSAGSLGEVVFLAGPSLSGGINLFAFQAETGAVLGAANLLDYNNIRHWLVVNGVLYAAVGHSQGGGRILRWTGTAANPIQFEEVGVLDADGADLALHEGRIFVTTWPNFEGLAVAGLWMSPPVPSGGLRAAHAGSWTKVWEVTDYEPDLLVAATYGGGALCSYKGYLYWGTMHVPFLATTVAVEMHETGQIDLDANQNGQLDTLELLDTALGTHRAISVFRGRDFASYPRLEVLYGERYLPVYDPVWRRYMMAKDRAHQNRMSSPRWGASGMGNFYNAYTWTMATYGGQLFIGTFDWSYLMAQGLAGLVLDGIGLPPTRSRMLQTFLMALPNRSFGADLFAVSSSLIPAKAVSTTGVGNYTNYGIRTMVADSDGLYLGMANPMNLLTNPDDRLPEGGWELIRLSK